MQVAMVVLRDSWRWGAILGGALIIRYLLDTLAPPTDYVIRAQALTYTVMAIPLVASFVTASRTHSMAHGVLIALSAAVIGALLSIIGSALMLAVWHDPATLDAWQQSGGLNEAFKDVPLKVVALGAVFGMTGAALGRVTAAVWNHAW
jgi:hypothetical protein